MVIILKCIEMKKIIKIIGILICLVVLFLNISLNKTSSKTNTDLSVLIVTNNADAECWPFIDQFWGECSLDQCFTTSNWPKVDCDPTRF